MGIKKPEQRIQIAVFKTLTPLMVLQKYSQFMAFQVKNETSVAGEKGARLGKYAKDMGTMAGVSDTIFIFPARQGKHALENYKMVIPEKVVFVEFKALKPLKTRERKPEELLELPQEKFRDRVNDLGFEYRIIAAMDENDAINQVFQLLRENGVKC